MNNALTPFVRKQSKKTRPFKFSSAALGIHASEHAIIPHIFPPNIHDPSPWFLVCTPRAMGRDQGREVRGKMTGTIAPACAHKRTSSRKFRVAAAMARQSLFMRKPQQSLVCRRIQAGAVVTRRKFRLINRCRVPRPAIHVIQLPRVSARRGALRNSRRCAR